MFLSLGFFLKCISKITMATIPRRLSFASDKCFGLCFSQKILCIFLLHILRLLALFFESFSVRMNNTRAFAHTITHGSLPLSCIQH